MANLLIFNLKTDADDDVLGFTTSWINALAARFDRVFVITMDAGRLAVAENVQVLSVGKEKGYSEPRRLLMFYWHLTAVLLRNRISGCFAHMMPLFLVLGAPLLKLKRVRTLLWYTHKHSNLMLRAAYAMCDLAVTASRESFPLEGNKVEPIGHGIDVERFRPCARGQKPGSPLRVLTVGRISPVKRLEVAIEGLALFRKRNPGLSILLEVVGGPLGKDDEEYLAGLKSLASHLGVEKFIHFAGSRPFREVEKAYAQADCFVNMCDTGGVDKAVLEAMSSSLPIVTSNSSFKEVLGPVLAAEWVVESGNAEQVAGRLERIHSMGDSESQELGARFRGIVTKGYSLGGLAERITQRMGTWA